MCLIQAGTGDVFGELGGEEKGLADAGLGVIDALEVGEEDRALSWINGYVC